MKKSNSQLLDHLKTVFKNKKMPEYLHSKLIRISNAKTNSYLVVIVIAYIPGYDDDAHGQQSACYSLTGGSWKEEPSMLEKRTAAASSIWPGRGLLVTGGVQW